MVHDLVVVAVNTVQTRVVAVVAARCLRGPRARQTVPVTVGHEPRPHVREVGQLAVVLVVLLVHHVELQRVGARGGGAAQLRAPRHPLPAVPVGQRVQLVAVARRRAAELRVVRGLGLVAVLSIRSGPHGVNRKGTRILCYRLGLGRLAQPKGHKQWCRPGCRHKQGIGSGRTID